jgi:hypothetical protein
MGGDAGTPRVVRVVVAGGHDQVARRLERLLASAGHTTVGIVRNPDHVGHAGRRGPGLLDDVEPPTWTRAPFISARPQAGRWRAS